jgi:hypothetical protein
MGKDEGFINIRVPNFLRSAVINAASPPLLDQKLLSRGLAPLAMGVVAAGVYTLAEIVGIANGTPPLPEELFYMSGTVLAPVVQALVGLAIGVGGVHEVASRIDDKNCVNFTTLSVTKHIPKTEYLKHTYPELAKKAKYFGELHFSNDSPSGEFPERRDVVMNGFNDLIELIELCENNDVRLEGVEFFAGQSSLIHPRNMGKRLAKLGFQIKEYDKPEYRGWDSWINGDQREYRRRENHGLHIPNDPGYVGVIERDALVAQKETLIALRDRYRERMGKQNE